MKKTFLALILLLVAGVAFALEGAVTWMWYVNDDNVRFYRYQLDGEDPDMWTVVDDYIDEVTLDVDLTVEHVLYLQQSYDGEHWSNSSCAYSDVFEEEEEVVEEEIPTVEEEPVIEEEVFEEVSDESVEVAPVEPEHEYKPSLIWDVGVSYANTIPHGQEQRTLGLTGSATYLCVDLGTAQFGPKANLGVFSTKDIVFDPSNTKMYFLINAMACLNLRIASSDVFTSVGPEFGIQVGSEPGTRIGGVVELGFRYHRTDRFSIGLIGSDHYYIFPTDKMLNEFELRLICSFNFD